MVAIHIISAHQQQRLVVVTVKPEPRARWSLVPHCPEVGDAATGVECVGRINEDESPFLLILLLGKEGSCRVHRALYPGFEAVNQLRIAACVLGLGTGHLQDTLGQDPALDIVDPDCPDAWALIQCHQSIVQEGTGCGPGQEFVFHPVGE